MEKLQVKEPKDELDACCKIHGMAHAQFRSDFPFNKSAQERCLTNADCSLYYCSRNSGKGIFLIEDYMQKSSPPADLSCEK